MDERKEPDVTKHLDEDRPKLAFTETPDEIRIVRDVGLYYRGYYDAMRSVVILLAVGILLVTWVELRPGAE